MPRQIHWRELTGGIIAVAVIAVLAVVTLVFARVGGLHGKKVTLYVLVEEATGVRKGTEVWLAGQKEGLVKGVSFRSASTDTLERLIIKTEFLEEALPVVRRDSYAQIRPAGSFIGAPVVFISAGSATSPQLHDGDTLHTRPKQRIASVASDINELEPELSGLASSVKELSAKLASPAGTFGAARTSGIPQMPGVSARMSRIASKASYGYGTLGMVNRTHLMSRASHAMAAADSIRTLMSSNKASLGRFRRDSTLTSKATGVLAQLDTLRALASHPVGSIAAAHSDSSLTQELDRTHALLASLIKDIKKHPLRYINF
jgi:ABC-type transporter Mla subunit MlaD